MGYRIDKNDLPHNRISKIIDEKGEAVASFKDSMSRWINSLLLDDELSGKIETMGERCKAIISCKQDGIFAGKLPIDFLLENWIDGAEIEYLVSDGDSVKTGDGLMLLSMSTEQILKFERVILNIIARLSGIATTTNNWTKRTHIPVASTRKTTWGLLDKWAVHIGGGLTHRLSREDALMIKENDIISSNLQEKNHSQNIANTIDKIRENNTHGFIVIEVRSVDEAIEVAEKWTKEGDDPLTIMLDNMSPKECNEVAELLEKYGLRNSIILEASGGIILEKIDLWENSGVDVISTSSIHRGTAPLDISLLIVKGD